MKNILLLTMGIMMTSVSFAQKHTVLIGGNIEFRKDDNTQFLTASSITKGKSHSTNLSPYVGYQLGEKLTAGATLSIQSSRQENTMDYYTGGSEIITVETMSKNKSLAIGPFIRYTEQLSDIFSVFGQLEGLYLDGKTNTASQSRYPGMQPQPQPYTSESSSTGVRFRLFPAVFINVKRNFGLNLSFGGIEYQKYGAKDAKNKPSYLAVNFGKSASIGISKNF
ncbi:hypothetical protein [Niabella sp.]|uniref:hypothetical protein n=1 Tax=Niabella sp. TaxID=1962976 RepID=UPI0026083BA8|nr:hypothetical protein [Niabella sp.]